MHFRYFFSKKSNTWLKFNVDKCVIMNIGTQRNKSKFEYKMKNKALEVVKHHPYLGVELTDNMNITSI